MQWLLREWTLLSLFINKTNSSTICVYNFFLVPSGSSQYSKGLMKLFEDETHSRMGMGIKIGIKTELLLCKTVLLQSPKH